MITLSESIDKRTRSKGQGTARATIMRCGFLCKFVKNKNTLSSKGSTLKVIFSPSHGSKLLSHPLQSLQRWLNSHSTTIRKYRLRSKR